MTTRRFYGALASLVALFAGAVALGQFVVRPTSGFGSPSTSRVRVVEDLFPTRHLTVADIRRGGRTCLEGHTLVVPAGGGCTFIVPDRVHVVVFRRVPGSASMMLMLSQTVDLTQTIDTGRPGPDPRDPLRLRLAAVNDGTTVTLYGCRGPGSCRLEVSS